MEASAPQVVGSLPPLEEFAAPVCNQVHQEQVVAGETTQNKATVQEQVTVQEIPEVQVVQRIQEQTVDTMYPIEHGMSRIGTIRKDFFNATADWRQASWSASTKRSADIRFKKPAESIEEVVRQRHVGRWHDHVPSFFL